MYDSLGSIFVFMTSALAHSDSGKAVHLLMWGGGLSSKILEIGDLMVIPKYLIPSGFHTKGVLLRSTENVSEFKGIASLLLQVIWYPENLPKDLINSKTFDIE